MTKRTFEGGVFYKFELPRELSAQFEELCQRFHLTKSALLREIIQESVTANQPEKTVETPT